MDRRTLLTALPAFAATSAVAGFEILAPDFDPLVEMVDRWRRLHQVYADVIDTPEEDAVWSEKFALEQRICNTKPISREGVLAQMDYVLEDWGDVLMSDACGECRPVIHNLFEGVKDILVAGELV